MIALCRAARIPARPVVGFIVDSRERISADVWLEVLPDDHWIPYDPVNGYEKALPYNYVPARRGDDRIAIARQAEVLEIEYALVQLPRASLGAAAARRDPGDILDLTRLPLEMQHVLSLVLLMPLGALVTSVFRNLVGLRTSGTFTPTLLALSFVFGDWRTGLVILAAAVILGVATRYLVDRLTALDPAAFEYHAYPGRAVHRVWYLDFGLLPRGSGSSGGAAADGDPDDVDRAVLPDHAGRRNTRGPAAPCRYVRCRFLLLLGVSLASGGRPAVGLSRSSPVYGRLAGPDRSLHGVSIVRVLAFSGFREREARMNHRTSSIRSNWRCWAWPWELRRSGVLGMNARNVNFILPHNPRAHYPRWTISC